MSNSSRSPDSAKKKKRKVETETEDEDGVEDEEDMLPRKKKTKREPEKQKTDPAEWPSDDIQKLFEKVESLLPKQDMMKYTRRLEKLDWDKVKFEDYSSHECSSVFNTMLKRVRQHQNVSDFIVNMKSVCHRKPRLLQDGKMEHLGPKKPLSVYFMFTQDKKKKLQRKNPNLNSAELSKLLGEKYKALSPRKKQKYFDRYNANMETYREESAKFKMPKCPTPLALFIEDRIPRLVEDEPELTHRQAYDQAAQKWKRLKSKKKLKWIKKAVKAFEEVYQPQCTEYHEDHPTFVPKLTCLNKQEQHLKDTSEGMPEKPPQSGFQLFKTTHFNKTKREGESFASISGRLNLKWKTLPDDEKEEYNQEVKQTKQDYAVAYEKYLESLPEERRQQIKEAKSKVKAAVNGGMEDEDSDFEAPSTSKPTNQQFQGPLRSALSFFIEEQCKEILGSDSDTSQSDLTVSLTKKFKQLQEEEKQKYRDMASKQRKQTLMSSYLTGVSSKNKPKAHRSASNKPLPGEPKKPPSNGYSLYSCKMLLELTDIPSNKRMAAIGRKWRELSQEEKEDFNRKAKKKQRKYAKALEAFKQMAVAAREEKGVPRVLAKSSLKKKSKWSDDAKHEIEPGKCCNKTAVIEAASDEARHVDINDEKVDDVSVDSVDSDEELDAKLKSSVSFISTSSIEATSVSSLSMDSDEETMNDDVPVASHVARLNIPECKAGKKRVTKPGKTCNKPSVVEKESVIDNHSDEEDSTHEDHTEIDRNNDSWTARLRNRSVKDSTEETAQDNVSLETSVTKESPKDRSPRSRGAKTEASSATLDEARHKKSVGRPKGSTKINDRIFGNREIVKDCLPNSHNDEDERDSLENESWSSKLRYRKKDFVQDKLCVQNDPTFQRTVDSNPTESSGKTSGSEHDSIERDSNSKKLNVSPEVRKRVQILLNAVNVKNRGEISQREDQEQVKQNIIPPEEEIVEKFKIEMDNAETDEEGILSQIMSLKDGTVRVDDNTASQTCLKVNQWSEENTISPVTDSCPDLKDVKLETSVSVDRLSVAAPSLPSNDITNVANDFSRNSSQSISAVASQDSSEILEYKADKSGDFTGSDELFSSVESSARTSLANMSCQSSEGIGTNESEEKYVVLPRKDLILPGSVMNQIHAVFHSLQNKDTENVAAEILSSIKVTAEEAQAVELATHGQTACDAWYFHRRGRITASSFARVCNLNGNQKESLLKKLLQDVRYPTSSWGLDHEQTALNEYRKVMHGHHDSLRLTDSGFVINPAFPHLGASPDSWVDCKCCGLGVVEIKCPVFLPAFKTRQNSRCAFTFLMRHDKAVPLCVNALPCDHDYYYQVQGQMAVCDVQYCDFLCWTPNEIHIERIRRDVNFFKNMKQELDSFYLYDVIPAIVAGTLAETS